MTKNIVSNNCQIPIPDCFNKNGLSQLGVNPFNEPPTLSELAFENRYGGSKTTKRNIKRTTKRTTKRKTNSTTTKRTNKRKNKMKGGQGYYLKLDDLINNMPVVKSYDSCCPPLFDGKLLTNKI